MMRGKYWRCAKRNTSGVLAAWLTLFSVRCEYCKPGVLIFFGSTHLQAMWQYMRHQGIEHWQEAR